MYAVIGFKDGPIVWLPPAHVREFTLVLYFLLNPFKLWLWVGSLQGLIWVREQTSAAINNHSRPCDSCIFLYLLNTSTGKVYFASSLSYTAEFMR